MLKALLRKQLMELNAWLYLDKKKGKRRSKAGMVLYGLLYAVICLFLGVMFFFVSMLLCGPLTTAGLGWLYFAVMGLMSMTLGVFGSVFNTFSSLYQAKDNDLLLSLPIPTSAILVVRLFGVFFWGLFYVALVMIPALLAYYITGSPNISGVICSFVTIIVISIFVLTLSCILGWIVAKVNAKLKHKSFLTVLLSLAFIGGYYYIYFHAYELLQLLLVNGETVGAKIKGVAYPIYLMGYGAQGNALSMLLFTAIVLILFSLVWFVLSQSFLKLATASQHTAKKRYKETMVSPKSIDRALLFKEIRHFVSSSTYMLNCGLGTLLLVIVAVLALVKGQWIREVIGQLGGLKAVVPLLACAGICMLTTMNNLTAPSVSLEGKNIWLVQSLPVSSWQVLKAKLNLHLLLTEFPAVLCSLCIAVALRIEIVSSILIALSSILFVLFTASFGLAVNLKMPNLNWTNETVAVKQSIGVMIALFGGWVLVVILGGIYFLLSKLVAPNAYLLICAILVGGAASLLLAWLRRRGTKIFEQL